MGEELSEKFRSRASIAMDPLRLRLCYANRWVLSTAAADTKPSAHLPLRYIRAKPVLSCSLSAWLTTRVCSDFGREAVSLRGCQLRGRAYGEEAAAIFGPSADGVVRLPRPGAKLIYTSRVWSGLRRQCVPILAR
jgi:hypothetical protein